MRKLEISNTSFIWLAPEVICSWLLTESAAGNHTHSSVLQKLKTVKGIRLHILSLEEKIRILIKRLNETGA